MYEQWSVLVKHEWTRNNSYWCAGSVWVHTNCMPMGRPFSAQGADLTSESIHDIKRIKLFRRLGQPTVSFECWKAVGAGSNVLVQE